jgi:CubicO group peptidase (beta-lactamase class C family)
MRPLLLLLLTTTVAAQPSLYEDLAHDPHQDLKAIVILQNGHLLSEHYFNGDTPTTLHDIRSATKSITALLMGIAIQQHLIHSTDDPITTYLPQANPKIRIADLLTMRSGLDANDEDPASPGNEDNLDAAPDWLQAAYAVPLKTTPGTHYQYCSLNAFLTGLLVETAAHTTLEDFARTHLFTPLGITDLQWRQLPASAGEGHHTTGQGNLSLTARDAATLGQLMLDDGIVHGHRLLPHAWVERSLSPIVPISAYDPYADAYGYMWYTRTEPVPNAASTLVHFASGNGGNKIYLIPSRHMVVVITSSAYNTRYGQRRSQDILLRILATPPAHP